MDPIDPDTVIVGGVYMVRSLTGGAGDASTWIEASSNNIHLDHHMLVEDPGYNRGVGVTQNRTVYACNDGGIHRTTNILATAPPSPPFGPIIWTHLVNQPRVTQFYGAAGSAFTGKIIGGTQDNATLVSPPQGSQNWGTLFGNGVSGDGGVCAVDQTTTPYYYGEGPALQICRSIDGGSTKEYIYNGIADAGNAANTAAPFILDPNNPNRMLAGGASLWRSNDVRNISPSPPPSWASIKPAAQPQGNFISAIAVAPGNSNIILVGHNSGSVYYTANGTAATPTWIQRNDGLPRRKCTRIAIKPAQTDDPLAPAMAFATFALFKSDNVWKTENGGVSWSNSSKGLPSAPVHSMVISPNNPNTIYIGTEVGVFASSDNGDNWSPSVGGANAPVLELFWMGTPTQPKLVAATHGRGMYTLEGPTSQ